jgi:hypothetical protein
MRQVNKRFEKLRDMLQLGCGSSWNPSQSQSHITTDGQSVCLGVEPKSGTFDHRFFFPSLKVTVLSFLGRPL